MRRFVLPIILLLAGCDKSGDGPVQAVVIGSSPTVADPDRGPIDGPQAVLLSAIGQGLVAFDADGGLAPALAERWMVTDDGLSYIFRLREARWPDGTPVTARQVVRGLELALSRRSANTLKPMLEAIDEIVVVTPQVIEIRLTTARPPLLELLAQPEFALIDGPGGPGPFRIFGSADSRPLRLVPADPPEPDEDGEPTAWPPERTVLLSGARAALAVARFSSGDAELVLGGTIADLPIARAAGVTDTLLRFDPARGLIALVVVSTDGVLADPASRAAVAMAIDRGRIVAAFNAEGWAEADAVLPESFRSAQPPARPAWTQLALAARRAQARAAIDDRRAGGPPPTLRIAMADAPGTRLLFAHLASDLSTVGIRAERVAPDAPTDLRLIDAVAPAGSAVWYLAELGCRADAWCDPAVAEALAGVRASTSLGERGGWLARADRALADTGTLIPIARPLRWSLVTPRLRGFTPNAHAVHPLQHLLDE